MARSVEVRGRIDSIGKLFITNIQHISKWIKAHPDSEIRMTLEEFGKQRSTQQNRYYQGVIVPMVQAAMNDFGNEMDRNEVHDWLKAKFNYKEVMMPNGVFDKVPVSTAKNDTIGFMDFIARIQKFGSEELFICIPDPDPNWETEFYTI